MKFLRLNLTMALFLVLFTVQNAMAAQWMVKRPGSTTPYLDLASFSESLSASHSVYSYDGAENSRVVSDNYGTIIRAFDTIKLTMSMNTHLDSSGAISGSGLLQSDLDIEYTLYKRPDFGASTQETISSLSRSYSDTYHIDQLETGIYSIVLQPGTYTITAVTNLFLYARALFYDSDNDGSSDTWGFVDVSSVLVSTADFTITAYTPVPGAVWLLGTGVLGLFGLRKRFKG